MEGVERTNVVIVYLNQWAGFVLWQDPYAIEADYRNRNCYNCKGFRHLARDCRNRGIEGRIGEDKRLEYGNRNNRERRMIEEEEGPNNLNRE